MSSERPDWVKVGQLVEWRGQEGMCRERIVNITEPQPGNYVLWTTIEGNLSRFDPDGFPINYKQVEPVPPSSIGGKRD